MQEEGFAVKFWVTGVEYKIRRVRRVSPVRSRALLSRYALHCAREAFDFNLAAPTEDESLVLMEGRN